MCHKKGLLEALILFRCFDFFLIFLRVFKDLTQVESVCLSIQETSEYLFLFRFEEG